jgi:hypothetical protein
MNVQQCPYIVKLIPERHGPTIQLELFDSMTCGFKCFQLHPLHSVTEA